MKKGYKAEYQVKKNLMKKFGKDSIFKIAIGGKTDFLVLGKNGKIEKLIEVKVTKKKKWYPSSHDLKQYQCLKKIHKKYKIPVEYWIKIKNNWEILGLDELKEKFFKNL
jgi:Holliday junction resolvase